MDAVKIVGDAKVCLEELNKQLREEGYKSAYSSEPERAKADWASELSRLHGIKFTKAGFKAEVPDQIEEALNEIYDLYGGALTQTEVLGVINDFLKKDYVVVGSSGSLPGDLQRMWETNEKYSYHMEYGYSCMGYEINGALGVKMAEPSKEVYAMVGDGSYLMLHSELVTSIQENKKINVLLFDNCGFGCINNLQMGNGMGSFETEFRNRGSKKLIPVDYAKVASGYGVKTYSVKTLDELRAALDDAKKQEISTLIDIKVLPKTMTNGYESWWHVGVAGVSEKDSIKTAFEEKEDGLKKARKY